MALLAPKLVLTPILIASASLAGRRWGGALSGWLIALPLTSGPVALFIGLELGSGPAADAAHGSLLGAAGQVAFAIVYATAARRLGWLGSLATGAIAFAVVALLVPATSIGVLVALDLVTIAVGLAWLASGRTDSRAEVTPPSRWDIPARAIVATALVVAISGAAPVVGGRAAGLLATFPVYVSVLTTFAHRTGGAGEAREVLFGLVAGLPGFATFFVIVGALVVPVGLAPSFGLALAAAVALNLVALAALRRLAPRPD